MLQLYINLRLTSMFVFVFICIPCDVSTNNYESLILWGKWNLNLECNRLPMKHTCNVKKLSDLNNVCKFISLINVHVGSPVWLKRWIRQPHVYISTLFLDLVRFRTCHIIWKIWINIMISRFLWSIYGALLLMTHSDISFL